MKKYILLTCLYALFNTHLFSQSTDYINEKENLFYSFLYKNNSEEAEKTFKEFIETTQVNSLVKKADTHITFPICGLEKKKMFFQNSRVIIRKNPLPPPPEHL